MNKVAKTLLHFIVLTGAFYYFGDMSLYASIKLSLLIGGEIYMILSSVYMYKNLKEVRYRFCQIPIKLWTKYIMECILIIIVFYFLLSEKQFMFAYTFPLLLLPFLLVIDILNSMFKR